MTDIRDRVRTVERSDRTCVANKAIAYRPDPADDAKMAGTLVRVAMSEDVSGIELDDMDSVRALSAVADTMAAEIASESPLSQASYLLDGVQLRATSKEILISIPGAERDLEAEEILMRAERVLDDYTVEDMGI